MFYLTAINSIFDAQVHVWSNNKFYGQKKTIAFRVVDGSVYQPPVSQVESQTVRWLFHGKITQRRWSRGWRRRWWREFPRWRSATPRLSRPRRTASRGPSTSRTDGREGISSVGSTLLQFSEVGAAFE